MITDRSWPIFNRADKKVVVTGGAGYIGSLLTGVLLSRGYRVAVVDDLLFGGDSILPYLTHPNFHFLKANVCDHSVRSYVKGADAVVHLAAIVGFPACQAVGRQVAWRYNVEATQNVFEAAEAGRANRFLLASTYSNYGLSANGEPVDETSPLLPQSLYAETKVAAEEYLLGRAEDSSCAPTVFRFATLFGISPRTRFDLLINQFVLEALTKRQLIIYQQGYRRSFLHVRDAVEAICLWLEAPEDKTRGRVYNVGADSGNRSKDEIAALVREQVPGTEIVYRDLTFGGDMRDICVSFAKIERELGFRAKVRVEEGIFEVHQAIVTEMIKEPQSPRYRNAQFIVD